MFIWYCRSLTADTYLSITSRTLYILVRKKRTEVPAVISNLQSSKPRNYNGITVSLSWSSFAQLVDGMTMLYVYTPIKSHIITIFWLIFRRHLLCCAHIFSIKLYLMMNIASPYILICVLLAPLPDWLLRFAANGPSAAAPRKPAPTF